LKLFILKNIVDGPKSPWANPYDKIWGMVVNAPNENEARMLANEHAKDEGPVWGEMALTSCQELKSSDTKEIVASFRACYRTRLGGSKHTRWQRIRYHDSGRI
jgi:hypothetical protein